MGLTLLPGLFYRDSKEDLVVLKGHLTGISVRPGATETENSFVITTKEHNQSFIVKKLSTADQMLLTSTEKPGTLFTFAVEKAKVDADLARLPVVEARSESNVYVRGDSTASDMAKSRFMTAIMSISFFFFGFRYLRRLKVQYDRVAAGADIERVDELILSAAQKPQQFFLAMSGVLFLFLTVERSFGPWLSNSIISLVISGGFIFWLKQASKSDWLKQALEQERERREKLGKRAEVEKPNHVKAVDLLLKSGSLNAQNELGQTPLHIAAAKGRVEAVELLIRSGATVDIKDKNGDTPLMSAVEAGAFGSVQKLLAAGASVMLKNNLAQSILEIAEANPKSKTVAEFLSRAVRQQNSLYEAIKAGDPDKTYRFAKSGAKVDMADENGVPPIELAVAGKFLEVVKKLIQLGVTVTDKSVTMATELGNSDLLQVLAEAKAKADTAAAAKAEFDAKNKADIA